MDNALLSTFMLVVNAHIVAVHLKFHGTQIIPPHMDEVVLLHFRMVKHFAHNVIAKKEIVSRCQQHVHFNSASMMSSNTVCFALRTQRIGVKCQPSLKKLSRVIFIPVPGKHSCHFSVAMKRFYNSLLMR